MTKQNKSRLVDKEEIRELISKLHRRQLDLLMEKIEDGYLEPQEQRLIWDMVKAHNIGIESIDNMVDRANAQLEGQINAMDTLDDEWTFGQ